MTFAAADSFRHLAERAAADFVEEVAEAEPPVAPGTGPGDFGPALAHRKPGSRADVLARLRSARDQLDAALRIGRPRPGRRHINIH